ncbi:MAG: DUF5658 family protein [Planctomycetota bacterium]|jgi:hypothetical protein
MPKSLDIPGPRRHWWTRLIDWMAESRSHRVICLVAGIWLLNWFDLAFTLLSYRQGMLHEQNPFARQLFEHGEASVMLYKIGLVLIGSYPLLRFRRARITELGALVILAAYALLAFRWSACVEVYTLSICEPVNMAEIDAAAGILPH